MSATLDAIAIDQMSAAQQDAYALTRAALAMNRARGNPVELANALEHNVQLWVAIRTLIEEPGNILAPAIRDNLTRLSEFVFSTTHREGIMLDKNTLDTLVNINIQLSNGLLKGANAKAQPLPPARPVVERRLVA
jgi:flagellar biosynthesis regulator FlaF